MCAHPRPPKRAPTISLLCKVRFFLKWVGKVVMPLSFIPPLLYCKRGLDNCREQKR